VLIDPLLVKEGIDKPLPIVAAGSLLKGSLVTETPEPINTELFEVLTFKSSHELLTTRGSEDELHVLA
jgi:hypothetical protein